MRRIILNIAVAAVTFASAASFTSILRKPSALPYCAIARNAESYNGKTIRTRATLIFGEGRMYVYEDCDPVSALASAVEFEGSPEKQLTRNYVEELLVEGSPERINKVEAIITGRFNGEYSRGCWGPAFHIAAVEIQLLSPVIAYQPQAADSTSRIRH